MQYLLRPVIKYDFEDGGIEMNEIYTQLVKHLIDDKKVDRSQVWSFVNEGQLDPTSPVTLRKEMEQWYIGMGITDITGKAFSLGECPFTQQEIEEANDNNEMILCVPKDLNKKQLGTLFRLETWALDDVLAEESIEPKDLWFKTKATASPEFIRESGIDITRQFREEKKVLFSLGIYMVFIGRFRYLYNKTPDSEFWIWINKGRYDRSGMLVAGFDRNKNFNVHGWMPHFAAGFLGARYGELPESLGK